MATQKNLPARKPNPRYAKKDTVNRATIEAYTGIILTCVQEFFQMSVYLKGILLLLVAALLADILWRHESTINLRLREKVPLAALAFVVVGLLSFGQLRKDWIEEVSFERDPNIAYAKAYGMAGNSPFSYTPGNPASFVGARAGQIILNGRLLKNLAPNYQIVGGVFFGDRPVDDKDQFIFSESAPYDIHPDGDMQIIIPWDEKYLQQVVNGHPPTSYITVAMPINLQDKTFKTLRDAEKKGGIIVSTNGGPP